MMKMAEMMKKFVEHWRAVSIGVWLDDTDSPPFWIVDICDKADNSATIKIFSANDEAEARRFAADLSAATGLPVR